VNRVFFDKVRRVLLHKGSALVGRVYSLEKTLEAMAARPFELHLELTNLCNANCVFCPYQFQEREVEFMSDEVFRKAVNDYVSIGGGSVGLTPIVGDALIDPKFLERVRYLRALPQVDRIFVTTNAILLDKHGIDNVLESGVSAITISTAGFDEAMYLRVYRSKSYQRMKRNVTELVQRNAALGQPVNLTIGLRADLPLDEVMRFPDFQPILEHHPSIDFTWSFTSAQGRVTREMLPANMKLRTVKTRPETCVQMYNGPIVIPDGTVMACSCVAAMDAVADLGIGNILHSNLLELWRSARMKELRAGFGDNKLNATCAGCDMYRDLELYRTSEGRQRAQINLQRQRGEIVHRTKAQSPFAGG
jgi:MoaA/NifB/PqqE/SkfB family radical SAM enzyme